MRSEKQIAASRANGARSRGPKTPEGKARAARNSLRHGLLARAVVLQGESRGKFDTLVCQLNEALRPESAIEHLFVGKMAAAHWRQLRLWELERAGQTPLSDLEMRLDRQFFRTFDRYLRLKAFLGETNPANAGATGLSYKPEPGSSDAEPHSSQAEPDSSQAEPNSARPKPKEGRR
jgi:hypothetical protein